MSSMPLSKSYHVVLTIAGSDSSGGAGIQADIKTITVLNAYAASVITAVTAQNTQDVFDIFLMTPECIDAQLKAVFDDIHIQAIKIGMLGNKACIEVVRKYLQRAKCHAIPIVLDPVMAAQTGVSLIHDDDFFEITTLFPEITLLTPNRLEAERLLDTTILNLADMYDTAKALAEKYACNILLKGGHMQSNLSTDVLYSFSKQQYQSYSSPFIKTNNHHGTGCTLSSAISCFLAKGYTLETSIGLAKNFIQAAILGGKSYHLGHGQGPLNHTCLLAEPKASD